MSKFTTTLKGLMALALGSFALGADAALPTVSDAPTDGQFADNTTWYIWQANDEKGYIVEQDDHKTSSKNNYLLSNFNLPTATAEKESAYWCFVGDATNGYSIYNKKGTAAKKLGVKYVSGGDQDNGALSHVKLYTAEELEADNTIVTNFHIGTYGSDGVYFEEFTTKGTNSHIVLNDRTVEGEHILAVWNACPNPTNFTGNKYLLKEVSAQEQLLNQARTNALSAIAGIGNFYHSKSAYNNLVAEIENASSTQIVNQCVERAMNAIDKKVVHLQYAPNAEIEGKVSYLGVVGDGNRRIAKLLPERGARTKWQIMRVPNTYTFKLRNTSTDTYTGFSDNALTTSDGGYTVDFKVNTSVANSVTLKFGGASGLAANNTCLTVKAITGLDYTDETTLKQEDSKGNFNANNYAWLITPAGIEVPHEIPAEGGYYVIRSNRALTATPNGTYADEYPGSLLGCYTPDREKARKNATEADNGKTFSNGVHVRQYLTGMQTIWKIVPQSPDGGYKIYSLMGEGENGAPVMGMTFGEGGAGDVTITDNPTTVYFINPSSYTGYDDNKRSPLPYGVAISSTPDATAGKCFHLYNYLTGNDDGVLATADFYVKANAEGPEGVGQKTNQGPVFYIERVSSTDVDNAKEAFKDYAKKHRMFELLKNVLTPDEQAYALEQKTSNPDEINSVAAARAYLMEGSQAASTRAFEKLDGKVIRIKNRLTDNGALFMNHNSSVNYVATSNSGAETDLDKLWTVEVVSPELRQIRLKNYNSGKYLEPLRYDNNGAMLMVDGVSAAGTFAVSRFYSLDGQSFFANLLGSNASRKTTALRALVSKVNSSRQLMRGPRSEFGCHWTLENAVADDVKNTQIDLTINAKGDLISIKPAEGGSLTKTANFPAAYTVKLTPKAAATLADAEATTPTEVVVPEANIKAATDGSGFEVNLAGLNVPQAEYTLNFPVGYFTANGKLAPALSKDVKVEDTTSIREVNAAEKGAEVIYDLQGRRVSKAGKGVYIINGVKTLVK